MWSGLTPLSKPYSFKVSITAAGVFDLSLIAKSGTTKFVSDLVIR